MNFKTYCILALGLVLLSVSSCKEKEIEKTYMNGKLKIDCKIPHFVNPGDSFTITASGITAPDGTDVAYYCTSTADSKRRDSLFTVPAVFHFEVPDTLGQFTLSVVAYPVQSSDKYYHSTGSVEFVIVKDDADNGSLTGIPNHDDDLVEELHSRKYNVTSAGGREWIRSNLSYVERDPDGTETFGRSYAGSKAMQNIFGAYYTWEEAQQACPLGWHLPSDQEWVDLLKSCGAPSALKPLENSPSGAGALMVKARFNGDEMWSYYRGVNITDKCISVIPAGYAVKEANGWTYIGYQAYAAFWTADSLEGQGVYRYIYKENDNVFVSSASKTDFAASVRCVR
ncbi:MAG: fibrobacter succinogenes major paralogous domain-containing protein [Bacteroidales bacterium]|nr:fibrobacter succinogenes major paralogous domain-containing protein [Bacteroidales bacterium]